MFEVISTPFALIGLVAVVSVVYLAVKHELKKAVADVKDLFAPAFASAADAHASAAAAHASAAVAHAAVKPVTAAVIPAVATVPVVQAK